jgi:hypothetical protein
VAGAHRLVEEVHRLVVGAHRLVEEVHRLVVGAHRLVVVVPDRLELHTWFALQIYPLGCHHYWALGSLLQQEAGEGEAQIVAHGVPGPPLTRQGWALQAVHGRAEEVEEVEAAHGHAPDGVP